MAYANILYEASGRLAYITLNRPEKLNTLSNELRRRRRNRRIIAWQLKDTPVATVASDMSRRRELR